MLGGSHARLLFTPEKLLEYKYWRLIREKVASQGSPMVLAAGDAQAETPEGQDKLDNLIGELVAEAGLIKLICEQHRPFEAKYANLYERVVAHQGLKKEQFRDGCIELLKGLSEEGWLDEITKQGDVVRLALAMHRTLKSESTDGVGLALENDFYLALRNHIKKLWEGDTLYPNSYPDSYKALPEMVAPSELAKFTSLVCFTVEDYLAVETAKNLSPFFRLYAGVLTQASDLRVRTPSLIIQNLFEPILDSRDPHALAWMRDLLGDEARLKYFSSEVGKFNGLREKLAKQGDHEAEEDDEAAALLRELTEIIERE